MNGGVTKAPVITQNACNSHCIAEVAGLEALGTIGFLCCSKPEAKQAVEGRRLVYVGTGNPVYNQL